MKLVNVVGARPNFVKIAPLIAAYRKHPEIEPVLVHTGQHFDRAMSAEFFEDLSIPRPDIDLGVHGGSAVDQTARIMTAFEAVLNDVRPDGVVVVGDVTSTLASALTAAKLRLPLAHVEAGLRSFDPEMPEELNRKVTDQLSDLLFCTEPSAVRNLRNEGIASGKIHEVGNIMIDSLVRQLPLSERSSALESLGLVRKPYGVVTLHRPSNTDDAAALNRILDALEVIQRELPLVLPAHPRLKNSAGWERLRRLAGRGDGLILIDPMGYLDFLKLVRHARIVLTDSGGLQEETTFLGVPCLTLRWNTERPITIELGTNRLVGNDSGAILEVFREVLEGNAELPTCRPELWDGRTAGRIVQILKESWGSTPGVEEGLGLARSPART